jgi:serine/threonine protein kinase
VAVIGKVLGHYEILEKLGAGGMGEVYRARDPRIGRDVAIKVLPREVATDPDRLRRFEQEVRAIGTLNHPNLLSLYDVGTSEAGPFLVSELLEGETLRARLAAGPLPLRKIIDWGVQICHGLDAAHERGVVHRDLKPENVFLVRDGRAKILDFGLARMWPSHWKPWRRRSHGERPWLRRESARRCWPASAHCF